MASSRGVARDVGRASSYRGQRLTQEEHALHWAVRYFGERDLGRTAPTGRDLESRAMLSIYDDFEGLRFVLDEWLNTVSQGTPGEHDPATDKLIRGLAATLIKRGDQLPEQLRDFVVWALFNEPLMKGVKRGAKTKGRRDARIVQAVDWIATTYALKPTGNVATDKARVGLLNRGGRTGGGKRHQKPRWRRSGNNATSVGTVRKIKANFFCRPVVNFDFIERLRERRSPLCLMIDPRSQPGHCQGVRP